jgi:hypothetical protein
MGKRLLRIYVLGLFVMLSVTLYSINPFVVNSVDANPDLSVSIPNGCEFFDGDDPNINGNCVPFSDGGTTSADNVVLTASSNEPADEFFCDLKTADGVPVQGQNADGSCKFTDVLAKETYTDLEDGDYTFQVKAVKEVTSNSSNLISEESAASPILRFTVQSLGGEGGGAGITGDERLAPGDIVPVFLNLLENENVSKISFFNLKYFLEQNKTTDTHSDNIACFELDRVKGGITEIICDSIIIFTGQQDMVTSNPIDISNLNSANIYSVFNSLNQTVGNNLLGCGVISGEFRITEEGIIERMGQNTIIAVFCEDYFIAFPGSG